MNHITPPSLLCITTFLFYRLTLCSLFIQQIIGYKYITTFLSLPFIELITKLRQLNNNNKLKGLWKPQRCVASHVLPSPWQTTQRCLNHLNFSSCCHKHTCSSKNSPNCFTQSFKHENKEHLWAIYKWRKIFGLTFIFKLSNELIINYTNVC